VLVFRLFVFTLLALRLENRPKYLRFHVFLRCSSWRRWSRDGLKDLKWYFISYFEGFDARIDRYRTTIGSNFRLKFKLNSSRSICSASTILTHTTHTELYKISLEIQAMTRNKSLYRRFAYRVLRERPSSSTWWRFKWACKPTLSLNFRPSREDKANMSYTNNRQGVV
jgi:hypothetical protein